jgi:hypothetical protein
MQVPKNPQSTAQSCALERPTNRERSNRTAALHRDKHLDAILMGYKTYNQSKREI